MPVTLPAAGGASVVSVTSLVATGAEVNLWWPNRMGAQPLYNVTATLELGTAANPSAAMQRLALPAQMMGAAGAGSGAGPTRMRTLYVPGRSTAAGSSSRRPGFLRESASS